MRKRTYFCCVDLSAILVPCMRFIPKKRSKTEERAHSLTKAGKTIPGMKDRNGERK